MENDTKLKQAFEKGLGIPSDSSFETLEFAKSEKWDSIAHMKLISAIEEAFSIHLDVDEIIGMSSYLVAREIVKKYRDAKL